LALQATREVPSAAFEALLTGQLRSWLVRMAEREEHSRVEERMVLLSTASFEGLAFHSDGVVFDMNQRLADMLGYE
jgi:PAS domain-containing protein